MIDPYVAAREIRPHLDELLAPTDVDALGAELDALLAAPASPETAVRLSTALSARTATREWVATHVDSDEDDVEMGYGGLMGAYQDVPAQRFVCPVPGCTHTAYVDFAGEEVGSCPIHHEALVPG